MPWFLLFKLLATKGSTTLESMGGGGSKDGERASPATGHRVLVDRVRPAAAGSTATAGAAAAGSARAAQIDHSGQHLRRGAELGLACIPQREDQVAAARITSIDGAAGTVLGRFITA